MLYGFLGYALGFPGPNNRNTGEAHEITVSALNKTSFQTRNQGLARLEFLNPASELGRISYRSSIFLCSWRCWRRGGGAGGAPAPPGPPSILG